MRGKRLIIYDLDGTLADTREDIALAVNHMLREMKCPALAQDRIAGYVGHGLHHLVKSCLKTEDPKQIEKGSKIYRRYYGEHMLDHTRLYPGAREVLDYFKERIQAVITNKPSPFSKDMLHALGVADYFSEIVGGDDGLPKKPNPAAMLAIMKRDEIPPAETLFIGDSRIDIETGRNAGVATVVVTHGFAGEDELKSAKPDGLFKDFRELLAAAKKEGW